MPFEWSRSVLRPYRRLPLTLAGCLLATPAFAGQGLITANFHRTNCSQTDDWPTTPTMLEAIDAISYHTIGNATQTDCIVTNVMNNAAVPHRNKPKILSSDGGAWTNTLAFGWIDRVAPTAGAADQREHYEHFEQFFQRESCILPARGCVTNVNDCNSFQFPKEGAIVDAAADFPKCTAGTTSTDLRKKLGDRATRLAPNGRLHRASTADRELRWATGGPPITLMGYSWMGALTGLRFDLDGYLGGLAGLGANGVNFTRVWAIEQWTALQVDCTAGCTKNGLTPFAGDIGANPPQLYDLAKPNPVFYARLRDFAQKASDRGIVVQLSLFDKSGLVEANSPGRWRDSPYRNSNNVAAQAFLPNVLNPDSLPRPEFVVWQDTPAIGDVHRAYLRRVAEEVGGVGNVMFEIVNEGRTSDWPDDPADMEPLTEFEEWQIEVAREMRKQLPHLVLRDAFNGELDGTSLQGKASDTGQTWTAQNVKVKVAPVGGRFATFAAAVPAGNGASAMSASLPVVLTGQNRASVRGNLSRTQGRVVIGFRDANGALEAQYDGASFFLRRLDGGGLETTLATYTPAPAIAAPHVRLVLDFTTNRASVYVNSALVLDAIAIPGGIPRFTEARLRGNVASGPFLDTHAAVDNFEVDTYNDL